MMIIIQVQATLDVLCHLILIAAHEVTVKIIPFCRQLN